MTLQANNPVAPLAQQQIVDVPLGMVGGNKFGRYPKISLESTYNMIVSDNALVPYAGYATALRNDFILANGFGRGLYSSTDADIMIAVVGDQVYKIDKHLVATLVSLYPMETSEGDVFITENNGNQIIITDNVGMYVYNWLTDTYYSISGGTITWPYAAVGNPGYCSFQNGNVIVALIGTQKWVLSNPNDATVWVNDAQHQGSVQSKPGFIKAAVPVPGGGNNIMIFGSTVAESWTYTGAALFPYQRTSNFNVDYGVSNPSSIAGLDNFVVWISVNENSGPTVLYSKGGGEPQDISTDGIDFLLAQIQTPLDVTGFLFRQDGHLIYQFTFRSDNISLAYDFETKLFFYVTDESLNYHPARQVVFFNGSYYFVSFNDAQLYKFDTSETDIHYSTTDVRSIPRIRITKPLRLPSQRRFILRSVGFTLEQGQTNPSNGATAAVDLSISRDGGYSFGNHSRNEMNLSGNYLSRFVWQRLGAANDITCQFRFSGFQRFIVADDGLAEVYQ